MPIAPGEAPNSTDAFERAAQLEAAGRYRAAAEILEELPRAGRDPRVDVQIVRLRHRAFSELRHDVAPTGEPAEPPTDLWPGLVEAPQLPAAELTIDTLTSAVHHHGCLIVRGLVTADQCARFRADIDEALTAFDAYQPAAPDETTPWYTPFPVEAGFVAPDPFGTAFLRQCGGAYASYAPRAFVEYRNALADVGLLDIVGAYLDSVPVLSINKFVLRRVSGGAEPAWHQDGGYLGISSRALNLWLSLSECGADTELMGLDLLPGRRRELAEIGTHDAVERRAISPHVTKQLARDSGRPVERPLFQPGDAILFDQYFIHRSDIRPLEQERYAIESWFFSAQDYPDHLVPVVAG